MLGGCLLHFLLILVKFICTIRLRHDLIYSKDDAITTSIVFLEIIGSFNFMGDSTKVPSVGFRKLLHNPIIFN